MPLLAPAPQKRRKDAPLPTVVLADGDEVALEVARQFFLMLGYEVETASGGVECLDKLRRLSDPVLVLDYELPWGGGDGLLAVLREDPILADTPVILTTAGPPRVRHVGLVAALPLLGILEKPVCPEVLLQYIRGVRPTTGNEGRRGAEERS